MPCPAISSQAMSRMRSRPPPGRPRGRGEVVSSPAILRGRDREAALADHPPVAVLGARPLARPHVPAVLSRLQAIPPPVEAPFRLELQRRLPRPPAQDLGPVAEELDVVVPGATDGSPRQARRPADGGALGWPDEVPVRFGDEFPAHRVAGIIREGEDVAVVATVADLAVGKAGSKTFVEHCSGRAVGTRRSSDGRIRTRWPREPHDLVARSDARRRWVRWRRVVTEREGARG